LEKTVKKLKESDLGAILEQGVKKFKELYETEKTSHE
jgi:hypothetical protein